MKRTRDGWAYCWSTIAAHGGPRWSIALGACLLAVSSVGIVICAAVMAGLASYPAGATHRIDDLWRTKE